MVDEASGGKSGSGEASGVPDLLARLEEPMGYAEIDGVSVCSHRWGPCCDLIDEAAGEIRRLRGLGGWVDRPDVSTLSAEDVAALTAGVGSDAGPAVLMAALSAAGRLVPKATAQQQAAGSIIECSLALAVAARAFLESAGGGFLLSAPRDPTTAALLTATDAFEAALVSGVVGTGECG